MKQEKNYRYDLKALNIPALNSENYLIPLAKLISKTWQAFTKKVITDQAKLFQQEKLNIEKEKFELEKQIFHLQKNGLIDLEKIKEKLSSREIKSELLTSKSFLDAFHKVKYKLADGATTPHLMHVIKKEFDLEEENAGFFSVQNSDHIISEFIGEIIIQGLVTSIPPTNEFMSYNVLTDLGIKLAKEDG